MGAAPLGQTAYWQETLKSCRFARMAIAVRRVELLRACGGDEEQLELVLRLLRKDGGGKALTVAVEASSADGLQPEDQTPTASLLPAPVANGHPRETRHLSPLEARVRLDVLDDRCRACIGKRATRLATSMRDLEENPVDFCCGKCGRVLDAPLAED